MNVPIVSSLRGPTHPTIISIGRHQHSYVSYLLAIIILLIIMYK